MSDTQIEGALPDTSHVLGEAPISSELREEAKASLEIIKDLIKEARQKGTLSAEDEATLAEWAAADVKPYVDLAEESDKERQAILGGQIAENALRVVDNENVVLTKKEVTEAQSPDSEHTAVSGGGRVI
jgi:hypothetical protein